jgi:hypothetical protein
MLKTLFNSLIFVLSRHIFLYSAPARGAGAQCSAASPCTVRSGGRPAAAAAAAGVLTLCMQLLLVSTCSDMQYIMAYIYNILYTYNYDNNNTTT